MNVELTKNNHMVWGYNSIPWTDRKTLYDKFFITYGKINQVPSNFRESCINAAKEIEIKCKNIKKRPLIYYSGGIDSESIIAAFLIAGIDFSVAHIKYLPNYNDHEYFYVQKFIKKYSLDYKEYSVDAEKFLTSTRCFDLAVRDNARLIETHLLTSITDQIRDKYYPILDHPGTMLFRKNLNLSEPGDWHWKDFEHIMFFYNYCKNENLDACPSFYHWSPEIILAFLLDPLIKDMVSGKIYGKITNRTSTLPLYNNTFPEFNFERRNKYGGFEFISKKLINELNNKLIKKTFYDRHSGQEYAYNDLIKNLGYANTTN
jgi:hypothetical protein